jgi:hypothetical protein
MLIQNTLIYEEVMDGTQYIPYDRLCLLLTSKCNLELGGMVQVLYLTYRLIIVIICAKLFQNLLNYEEVLDRTQYIPFNRQC